MPIAERQLKGTLRVTGGEMEAVFSPFIIFMLSFMSLPNDDVVDVQNIVNKCLFNTKFDLSAFLGYLSYVIFSLPSLRLQSK